MTDLSKYAGKFVWYDQMSNDLPGAEAFYSKVVGWKLAPNTMNDQRYTILQAGDSGIGGLMPIPEDARKAGAQAMWMGYIWVDDVDAAGKRVSAAGGRILRGPMDIPNVGRFAVAGDPHGAGFIIFRADRDDGPPPPATGTPGMIGWRELHAGDGNSDFAFYSGLFGWTKGEAMDMGPMGTYQIFNIDGQMAGGIMTKTADMPMPMWLYYINVEAIDAAAERVKASGGKVVHGPMEVPGGQWTLQGLDPQGALFALVAPKR